MTAPPKDPVTIVGLVRPRAHCTFNWRQPADGGPRTVEATTTHCAECVDALEKQGYRIVRVRSGRGPE